MSFYIKVVWESMYEIIFLLLTIVPLTKEKGDSSYATSDSDTVEIK